MGSFNNNQNFRVIREQSIYLFKFGKQVIIMGAVFKIKNVELNFVYFWLKKKKIGQKIWNSYVNFYESVLFEGKYQFERLKISLQVSGTSPFSDIKIKKFDFVFTAGRICNLRYSRTKSCTWHYEGKMRTTGNDIIFSYETKRFSFFFCQK